MQLKSTLTLTSTLALLAATPALADLTAEQVLQDQLRQMENYGLTAKVTNQTRSGDTLTVDGISAAAEIPEGNMSVEVGGLVLRELGDGTVKVTYPDSIPVKVSGTSADDESFEMELSVVHSNTSMIVSGIPEEIRYDFSSDKISIEDMKFLSPAEAAELDMDMNVSMTGMTGAMELIGGGTVRDYTADFKISGMSGTIAMVFPDDEDDFNLAFEGQDLVMDYEGALAPQKLMASYADSILAGNKSKGSSSHGPISFTVKANTPDGTIEIASAFASGSTEFDIGKSGIAYTGQANEMTLTVGGSSIPLPPLNFKMAQSGGRFAMPVVPSDETQNFALGIDMKGLEVDQMLWGMIDPTGQLPRDPADLSIDMDGAGKLTQDIFAPEFAEEMNGAPGELESLTVNKILLSLAGAELTGDGAFTFNNAGGIPMPAGTLNANLKGANGLLDKLVNMGLVPEEQAMGARMMMGLFARPGEGEDTLTSTIEFKEDGSILANGQRIQ